MKKIMFPILSTLVVLLISVNFSAAQENKERAKVELHPTQTEKVQADAVKSYRLHEVQKKKVIKARPVREKARIKTQPADIKRER